MTKTVSKLSAVLMAGVVALAAFSLYAFSASADYRSDRGDEGDSTKVEVENEARVSNNVSVTANTGGNEADGGNSGDGSRIGSVRSMSLFGGQTNQAGSGGDGGTITTGDATAYGTIFNDVNSNQVYVEGCGCEEGSRFDFLSRFFSQDEDGKSLEVEAENEANLRNRLNVFANTGENEAEGGNSQGGAPSVSPWLLWFQHMNPTTAGGEGGTITTGKAYADGYINNVVNRNVVRVLNGAEEEALD